MKILSRITKLFTKKSSVMHVTNIQKDSAMNRAIFDLMKKVDDTNNYSVFNINDYCATNPSNAVANELAEKLAKLNIQK